MLGVFVYELILNSREQGSPLSFKVSADLIALRSVASYDNFSAYHQPHVRALIKRSCESWSSLPSVHEICPASTTHNTAWLFVASRISSLECETDIVL